MLGGPNQEEHASAAQCLWTLCFDSEVRDLILKEPASIERLEQCAASEDSATRVAARGALWKLREEQQLNQHQLEKSKRHSCMFVYYVASQCCICSSSSIIYLYLVIV